MGRRKAVVKDGVLNDFLKRGDLISFKGLKARVPKLGAWSFELVGIVKNVTPLTVKVVYCNYPSHYGLNKEVEVNRRQWMKYTIICDEAVKRKWKLLSEIDEK
jgi:hypothetical protein